MSPEFPPKLSTRATVAIAAVALVTLLYSLVVAGQILLWFIVVGFAVGLYLTYLLIVAVFRLVAAVERIATAAEVDSGIRDPADAAGPGVGADDPVTGRPGDTAAPADTVDAERPESTVEAGGSDGSEAVDAAEGSDDDADEHTTPSESETFDASDDHDASDRGSTDRSARE